MAKRAQQRKNDEKQPGNYAPGSTTKSAATVEAESVREEDVFVHDLKNILLGIVGNLSLAGATVNAKDPSYRFILSASQSASRACRFAEDWIRDRHRSLSETAPVDLPELIRDCFRICEVADKHRFKIFGAKECPVLDANAHQLRQVFNNLFSNAIQSTPASGRIHVRLRRSINSDDSLPSELDEKQEYLTVSVEDEGPGIPAENREHLFRRGFSTKETGCGVGLAGARHIMRMSGGTLSLGQGKLKGACINVWIPLGKVLQPPQPEAAIALQKRTSPEVLVMDDEPMVREVLGEMLNMLGFIPHFAESGDKALALFEQRITSGNPFAFVILDLNLPGGIGGEQIIEKLLAMDAATRAIVTSGLLSNRALLHYADYGFSARLPKPYSIADLATAVETLGLALPGPSS